MRVEVRSELNYSKIVYEKQAKNLAVNIIPKKRNKCLVFHSLLCNNRHKDSMAKNKEKEYKTI